MPANGFTYIGNHQPLTLNNGAPALNNGSLRSLPEKKNNAICHPENFQRNETRYSRKQENGYLRSETVIGFPRDRDRDREREYERRVPDYSEPEYSIIPESGYEEFPRSCSHNTFNC